jgi:hypothetical protein
MIAMLMAAAMTTAPINCRPKDLWRRQAGQSCLTPGPTIAPAHVEAVHRQLKALVQARGELDPATAAAMKAENAKHMAAQGIRRRSGPPADPAPFRKFESRAAPKVCPYAN